MNFTSEFNKENLIEVYSENKLYLLPLLGIIVSIFLLLFFVLPQAFSFPSNKSQADVESVRLAKMQDSYDFLSKTDPKLVDANLVVAQRTLPDKKDFESVLNAISLAAGNSSTQIIDYTFKEGNQVQAKYSALLFKIELAGGVKEAISFINELYKAYPLSSVESLSNTANISAMEVNFYYRAFPPITADDRQMVGKMNGAQEETLKLISEWTNTPPGQETTSATPSATTTSSPF